MWRARSSRTRATAPERRRAAPRTSWARRRGVLATNAGRLGAPSDDEGVTTFRFCGGPSCRRARCSSAASQHSRGSSPATPPCAETLAEVTELATVAVPQAEFAGITMTVDSTPGTWIFTHPEVSRVDRVQYDTGDGPCLDAWRTAEVQTIESTQSGRAVATVPAGLVRTRDPEHDLAPPAHRSSGHRSDELLRTERGRLR